MSAPLVAGSPSLPLRRAFREELDARIRARGNREDPPWTGEWDGWDDPRTVQPEVLLSLGYDRRFGRGFQSRGGHRALDPGLVAPPFRSMRIQDPCGRATMYAATPYVMLVDHRVLGPLPVPRRWSDLLEPDYRGEVAAPGGSRGISSILLLHFHLRHGMDGLRAFARSVRTCSHGSRLARQAQEGGAPAAVSIVPWIFARCAEGVDTEVVWPEEGAIASPMWISVREDASERALDLARFVAGAGLGDRLSRLLFPWADAEVADVLPEGAGLAWCGWDPLEVNDLDALVSRLEEEARRARHGNAG